MDQKTAASEAADPRKKYARWARIFISVMSFGMVFPNAITEGMVRTELPPYVADEPGDKNKKR